MHTEPVALITGGSSGIGRATALSLAREGWSVALVARGEAGLADAAAEVASCGARVVWAMADVADAASLRQAADSVVAALGVPQLWINCAGIGVYGRFATVPDAEFDRVTSVTYGGTVNGCRIALALMRPRGTGSIVNVCSACAFHGLPLMTAYSGAKAAVRGFTQALQAELSIEGSAIRVTSVFPPAVNTPFFSHAVSHMGWPARPAPPVYQPEVIAAGIRLAARTGQAEMAISGTALAFSLLTRLSPRLAAHLMTRLGFERQMTRDPAAKRLYEPTLFAPAGRASAVRGAFGQAARGRSILLWLGECLSALRRRLRPEVAAVLPPIRRPASP